MATVDSLEIVINAQFKQVLVSIKQLNAQINTLGTGVKKVGSTSNGLKKLSINFQNITKGFAKINASTDKITNSLKKMAKQFVSVKTAVNGVKKMGSAIESSMDYIENLNYFNKAFGQVAEKADLKAFEEMGYDSAEAYYNSFSQRAEELTQKMTGFKVSENGMLEATGRKNLGLDPSELMNYQAMFAQMSSSMGVASETSLKLSNALTMIGADLASVKNMDFNKVWEDMASGLAGMSRTLDKYGVNIRNVNLQQKLNELGIEANITKLNQNDKALLRTIILLDTTRYAWSDLSGTLEQPANQLRLIKANFSNLSRTIGNIFLPIVAKALPYINMFVQAIQRLAEWIVKLLGFEDFDWGSNTGNGASDVLGDIYDSADDTSDALDNVSKAAKKAKAGLRGFDELKTISISDTSGQDGDSDGVDGITTGLLEGALDDILEEYQKAWNEGFENMENRANLFADNVAKAFKKSGLYGVAQYFGESVKNMLDSINWESINQMSSQVGKSIAEFINGLVEVKGLSGSIGQTIAETVNTGIAGANSFFDNTNWDSIGTFIGDGLNNIVSAVNWEGIGHFISSKCNALFETIGEAARTFDWSNFGLQLSNGINTAISDFDWSESGARLGDLVKGLLNTIISLLENTDWGELGRKIAEFLSNIDWVGVIKTTAKAISDAALSLLDFALEFVENIDWSALGSGLWDALVGIIENIDWGGLISKAFELLGAAKGLTWGAIVGFAQSLWESLKSAFKETFKYFSEYINEAGGDVIEGLHNGITNALTNIGIWIYDHIFKPFINGFKKAFGIASPSKVMKEQGGFLMEGLFNGVSELVDKVVSVFKKIKDKVIEIWEALKSKTAEIWNGIKEVIKKPINGIIGFINGMISGVVDGINGMINALNKISVSVPDWVPLIGGKTLGFNISAINAPQIPYLANGAVFKGGNPFLAVVNDQRKGQTNVETPLKVIQEALREELSKFSVNSVPNANVFNYRYEPTFPSYAGAYGNYQHDTSAYTSSSFNGGNSEMANVIENAVYRATYNAISSAIENSKLLNDQKKMVDDIRNKPTLNNGDIFNAARTVYKGEAMRRYGNSEAFDPVWG